MTREIAQLISIEARLSFESQLAQLSSRFINLPSAEVDREIEGGLRRICEALDVDLAVLWQWSAEAPEVIVPTHYYPVPEGRLPSEPLSQEQYPWTREQMLAGRVAAFSSLDEMPAEAVVDRISGRALGIKSSLCLPLLIGDEKPLGALAFNTLRAERSWPEELVNRLQLVAQVFTNALARRRADEALRQSEERLTLAADAAEAGLWTLDFRTGVFWATERGLAIFGYSPDEPVSMERFAASIHPDDRDFVQEAIEQSARRGGAINVEYRILMADGQVRWIASRGRAQLGATGEPQRLLGISIDVTERKLGEKKLRASQARLAAGSELAGLAFYEVDFGAPSMHVDDRLRELCGVPSDYEQALQALEFWLEHLHPDDRERVLDLREQMHGGALDRLSFDYRYLHPSRGEIWIHHLAGVIKRDAEGRAVRTFGVFRDITESRRAEEALRQSYAEVQALRRQLEMENTYLKHEVQLRYGNGRIVGESEAIMATLAMVEQVAPTGATVLVEGETGVGKELVARRIHELSPRRKRPMVKVNCAALPSNLVESELFGREKGAFTGSVSREAGRFEVAHGSTIFLDEVAELPLELQAKLLRVLEEGQFERVGSSRTLSTDVRVIAATNRDLRAEVDAGRFRSDLYFRLAVFPIRVPPLRERRDDVPLLVWAMVGELSAVVNRSVESIRRQDMERLQRYSWPGNVRELRNLVERALILCDGPLLRLEPPSASTPDDNAGLSLDEAQRRHIVKALGAAGGQISGAGGAAERLGLKPTTLRSKMKRLGVDPHNIPSDNPSHP